LKHVERSGAPSTSLSTFQIAPAPVAQFTMPAHIQLWKIGTGK
jgi:hypothetical protein